MYGRGGMRGGMNNPRAMKAMMKQMGMENEDVPVTEIIMKTKDGRNLVFSNPSVTKMSIQGQETWQVIGTAEEKAAGDMKTNSVSTQTVISESSEDNSVSVPKEDIDLVAMQTGCDPEVAKKVLMEVRGNPAEAIMKIMSEQ